MEARDKFMALALILVSLALTFRFAPGATLIMAAVLIVAAYVAVKDQFKQ